MDKGTLLQYYRSQSEDYERMYRARGRRFRHRCRLEILREQVQATLAPEDSICDVGCGDGYASSWILGGLSYRRYVGVDLSETKLQLARARIDRSRCVIADGESCPLGDGTFQVALCLETLEHLPEPAKLLGEIHRLLAEGGHLFLSLPFDSWLQEPLVKLWHSLRPRREQKFHEHLGFLTPRDMSRWVKALEWKLIRWERCAFQFPFSTLMSEKLPYETMKRVDQGLAKISVYSLSINSSLPLALGSEFAVCVLQKSPSQTHN